MIKKVSYILLEDEPVTALALKSTLSDLRPDWKLLAAKESAAEIPMLLSLSPDFIMSDIFLCDGSCIDYFENNPCTIPLILLSGYPRLHCRTGTKANVVAFIEKPVCRGDLEEALQIVEKTIS